jgi:signal transduction histidine kinase
VLKSLLLLFASKLVFSTLVSLPYQLQYDEPYSFGSEYDVEIIYGESVLPEIMILLSLFSISLFLFFTIQIFRMKIDLAGYVVAFIFSLILLNITTSYMWYLTILEPALNQYNWFFSIHNIRFDLILETLMFTLFWYSMACFYSYRANIKPWITFESHLEEIELEARKQARREKESGRGVSAYAASKLKEAKELLDRGVISEEEFRQIKDDYLKK